MKRNTAMAMNEGFTYPTNVGAEGEGQTVLDYLSEHFPRASADEWNLRIRRGEVTDIAGTPLLPGAILKRGDKFFWHRPPWDEPDVPTHFGIVAEDDDFIAVDKPEGLPTLPGGGFLENTLLRCVARRCPGAVPMHRLGRGTTGIVLFAKTESARKAIQSAWRSRGVEKIYLAVVQGIPPPSAVISVPIGNIPHPFLGTVHGADPSGKPSLSEMECLYSTGDEAPFPPRSVVRVRIATGRPHQIRIHMAWLGHPLVSDPLFAAGGRPSPDTRAVPGDLGYRLHAWRLSFTHPSSEERVRLFAPPPEERWSEFRKVLPQLWEP